MGSGRSLRALGTFLLQLDRGRAEDGLAGCTRARRVFPAGFQGTAWPPQVSFQGSSTSTCASPHLTGRCSGTLICLKPEPSLQPSPAAVSSPAFSLSPGGCPRFPLQGTQGCSHPASPTTPPSQRTLNPRHPWLRPWSGSCHHPPPRGPQQFQQLLSRHSVALGLPMMHRGPRDAPLCSRVGPWFPLPFLRPTCLSEPTHPRQLPEKCLLPRQPPSLYFGSLKAPVCLQSPQDLCTDGPQACNCQPSSLL